MTKRAASTTALAIPSMLAAVLMVLAAPAVAQDMGDGMDAPGPGDGPVGPPDGSPSAPHGPKPIKRARFDEIVRGMFRAADTNRDGTVTLDELHAIVGARRQAIITKRFTAIDTDRNGAISPAEFTAWQTSMGSVASSDQAATGDSGAPISDAIMPDLGKDRALRELIEPLTGTVIAAANTNYDAGLSLAELLAYEGKLFDAADSDHDGYLWMQELRAKRLEGERMRGPGGPMGGPPPR